jgi:hypothetical protein
LIPEHLPECSLYRYAHELEEATSRLTLWVRQVAEEPYYACGGCGISIRGVHSWSERRVRDLSWGTGQAWLELEVHRVRCPRCGVRTERLPFVTGKAPYTTRLEAAIARGCEAAPVGRVAQAGTCRPRMLRRGRGYRDHEYLLLKVQKATAECRSARGAA